MIFPRYGSLRRKHRCVMCASKIVAPRAHALTRAASLCRSTAPTAIRLTNPPWCTPNARKPLAKAGAAVLAVDHLAKNADPRAQGPGGTAAKRRAIGGVSLRVKVKQPFTPGHGGSALLLVSWSDGPPAASLSDPVDAVGAVGDRPGQISGHPPRRPPPPPPISVPHRGPRPR